jgi:hypothetical protein
MTTKVDPAQNPKVERNVRSFLKALNSSGGKPLETVPPSDARQVLVSAQASIKLELAPCEIEDRTITQDGIDVSITIVRPADLKEKGPVFMFFHGGGWILGDFPTHERFVRDLVADSGFTAIFVNYTPSPEAHYPTAINQAYAAADLLNLSFRNCQNAELELNLTTALFLDLYWELRRSRAADSWIAIHSLTPLRWNSSIPSSALSICSGVSPCRLEAMKLHSS